MGIPLKSAPPELNKRHRERYEYARSKGIPSKYAMRMQFWSKKRIDAFKLENRKVYIVVPPLNKNVEVRQS